MRCTAFAIAIGAFLASIPARAFDASGIDIVGMHLGMAEAEVDARLAAQGYAATRTPDTITAKTLDGRLQVTLSADHRVSGVTYIFSGRGMDAPALVREAVMVRFGDPNQARPPTWCRAVGKDGSCPRDQASLTFQPDTLTLVLRTAADAHP